MYDGHVVRDFEDADFPALNRIHQERIHGALPNLSSPLFLVKKVCEVGGQVEAVCLLRISCETILYCQGSPEGKMPALEALQAEVLEAAYLKGIDDLHSAVFPAVARKFRKYLTALGWTKDKPHELWSRRTR